MYCWLGLCGVGYPQMASLTDKQPISAAGWSRALLSSMAQFCAVYVSPWLPELPHSMAAGVQRGMFQVAKVEAADLMRPNLGSHTITHAQFCSKRVRASQNKRKATVCTLVGEVTENWLSSSVQHTPLLFSPCYGSHDAPCQDLLLRLSLGQPPS